MNKLTTILLGAALIAGCQSNKDPSATCDVCPETCAEQDLAFFSEDRDQTPQLRLILASQTDNGAAADGMLRVAHFDGDNVNSLGTDKLDAIVRGTADGQPVRIHLDLPEDADQSAARQQAVTDYLADKGIDADRLAIQIGDNPATRHLATLNASKLYKVEDRVIGSAENNFDAGASTTAKSGTGQPAAPVPPVR